MFSLFLPAMPITDDRPPSAVGVSQVWGLFKSPFRRSDEPGKQVQSAINIKNTSKSHVAFKSSLDHLSGQKIKPCPTTLYSGKPWSFGQSDFIFFCVYKCHISTGFLVKPGRKI